MVNNNATCNGNIQLCGWRCLSGWLPWKLSARTLERDKGRFILHIKDRNNQSDRHTDAECYHIDMIVGRLRTHDEEINRLTKTLAQHTYCERVHNLGYFGGVSSSNPWAASHTVEPSGLVPACGAAGSGCRTLPDSNNRIMHRRSCSNLHTLRYTVLICTLLSESWTCMSWIMLLKAGERSVQVLTSSIASSKFLT